MVIGRGLRATHAASSDRSGRAGYVVGVMEEKADGGYKVRLGLSLSIHEKEPAPAAKAFRSGRPGSARQRSMTPLRLLYALREAAQLNCWHLGFRGKRGPGSSGTKTAVQASKEA